MRKIAGLLVLTALVACAGAQISIKINEGDRPGVPEAAVADRAIGEHSVPIEREIIAGGASNRRS